MKFRLDYKESHLNIIADKLEEKKCADFLKSAYDIIDVYIKKNPFFGVSYEPVEVESDAPEIVKSMSTASKKCGVGPMASVAGAIAQSVGKFLLEQGACDVVVENGGDIFLSLNEEKIVGIHAGPSRLSDKIGFKIRPNETPLSVCTSSASVGPSVSLGESDATVAIAEDCFLADAAATAIGNEVKCSRGANRGLMKAKRISGLKGALIIVGDRMAAWGTMPEIVEI